jgi:putative transposase
MNRVYRFRLYPNKEQVDVLNKTLSLCCNLYNACLEQRIIAYRLNRKVSYLTQQNELPELKEQLPEYKEVYAQVLQDVVRRIDKAFMNFFLRLKNRNGKAGFPRYKSFNRFRSITYPQFGFRILPNGHLELSKIGVIRMFKHREIKGNIKTCTIKKDSAGDWYAIFTVEIPDVPKHEPKTAIGVDVGIRNFVTLSTGESIPSPKFLKSSEDKIRRLHKEVSRKKIGSKNRKKCVRKLARAYRKVERQRDDFLHKVSRYLSRKADVIVFEDLNINRMVQNSHLSKSIYDACWSKLMKYTAYKVAETGGYVYFVNPVGTSTTCSRCGEMLQKSLSERLVCPICKFSLDRDWNASLNILGRLHTDRVELLKNACGDRTSTVSDCMFGRLSRKPHSEEWGGCHLGEHDE